MTPFDEKSLNEKGTLVTSLLKVLRSQKAILMESFLVRETKGRRIKTPKASSAMSVLALDTLGLSAQTKRS